MDAPLVTVTPTKTSVIIQIPKAGITLAACRTNKYIGFAAEIRRILNSTSVTTWLQKNILPPKNTQGNIPKQRMGDSFYIKQSGQSDLFIWNIPEAGLVLTAWCGKARTRSEGKEQQEILEGYDLSQILLDNFFSQK